MRSVLAEAQPNRASIQRSALAAARDHAISQLEPHVRGDNGRRRLDFDAALLALFFAAQFGIAVLGVVDGVDATRTPSVATTVASAHTPPAP